MNLVIKPLNLVLDLEALLPLLHGFLVLILGRNHQVRDSDTRSIARVNHCRVTGSGSLELGARLRCQVDNLAAPAEAHDTPLVDAGVFAVELIDNLGNAADRLWWGAGSRKELAELLALFLLCNCSVYPLAIMVELKNTYSVWWVPLNWNRLAFKEVRNEDLVLMVLVGMSKDISTLESLREEAENIVDDK